MENKTKINNQLEKPIQETTVEKKKEVYSIRITSKQKNLIRNNKNIKEDLDRYVTSYLSSFF